MIGQFYKSISTKVKLTINSKYLRNFSFLVDTLKSLYHIRLMHKLLEYIEVKEYVP